MTFSFRPTSLNISSTTRALWFARVFQRFVAMGVCAFLHAGALLLQELDPTLFIISAWNDNGLKGKARGDRPPHGNNATRPVSQLCPAQVRDRDKLLRTTFFPGLGWLLPRDLYQKEVCAPSFFLGRAKSITEGCCSVTA